MHTIDEVDYAILKCLDECNGCWKKRVHQWIQNHIEDVPEMEEKSVQTIGRRIDTLQENNLLESCILSPDAVNRDMIIGFKLTEHGRETLQETRTQMLKERLSQSTAYLIGGSEDLDIDRTGLIALMCDEFNIDDKTRETLVEPLNTRELLTTLTCHYIRSNADNTFEREHEELVAELIHRSKSLGKPFTQENARTRIQDTVRPATEQFPNP